MDFDTVTLVGLAASNIGLPLILSSNTPFRWHLAVALTGGVLALNLWDTQMRYQGAEAFIRAFVATAVQLLIGYLIYRVVRKSSGDNMRR